PVEFQLLMFYQPLSDLQRLLAFLNTNTLNEAKNLPHVLPRIPSWVHEVILVDGHSKDDTVAVAKKLMPTIRVVLETWKGKGAALQAGFAAAEVPKSRVIALADAQRHGHLL
ncbi:MAG: glycosyltransferase, partial [Chloroflexota bacterium]